MRFSLVVVVLLVGISASGVAQEKFKVKHTPQEKTKKTAVPMGKSASLGNSTSANSKDLQALEHQTARSSAPHAGGKKTSGAMIKPIKDKPNPPINLGSGGGASGGTSGRAGNPYKGRLKQKYGRQ